MGEFRLTIKMGNDAMQTHEDIASALDYVAAKLRGGRSGGYIRDINGNTVGEYSETEGTSDDD